MPDASPHQVMPRQPASRRPSRRQAAMRLGHRSRRWAGDVAVGTAAPFRAQRRIVVAAAALALLLIGARSGTPTAALVLLSAGFVVAASVWLHAQYVDDLDGEQWALSLRKAYGFAGAGVAAVVAGLVWHVPVVLPVGLIVTYYGVAFIMTNKRQSTIRVRRQLLFFSVGVILSAVGVLLLGHVPLLVAAGFLVAGLLGFVPYAGTLLAEAAIEEMAAAKSWWAHPVSVMLAGAAGLVATCGVFALIGSGSAVVGCGVLALLVAAVVSGTHAEFVAVMLVIALLGVTPREERPPSNMHLTTAAADARPLPPDRVLVALGDSYMSGEGASVFYAGTDHGNDGNQCRQSPTSWVAQAGQMPPFRGLLFLACQGATVPNLLRQGQPVGAGVPSPRIQAGTTATQLDAAAAALARDRVTPSLVVLSIGGNDAGFSGIGQMCLGPGECDARHEIWDAASNFAQLRAQLDALYDEVDVLFPRVPVAVIPYPDPIYAGPDGQHVRCGQLLLSHDEAVFVRRFLIGTPAGTPAKDQVTGLDPVLEHAAAAHGFYYVAPMQNALRDEHLQLCDGENRGQPGLNFIGLRSVQGAADQRFDPKNWIHSSLHPNARGHAALLRAFEQWYAGMLADHQQPASGAGRVRQLPPRAAPAAVVPAPPVPATGCRIADRKHGCRADGARWSVAEARSALLRYGWGLALLALFAATFAAGFIGWRRSKYTSRTVPFP